MNTAQKIHFETKAGNGDAQLIIRGYVNSSKNLPTQYRPRLRESMIWNGECIGELRSKAPRNCLVFEVNVKLTSELWKSLWKRT